MKNGLHELRRPTVEGPWSDAVRVADGHEGYPSLSPDGLMLFSKNESGKNADGKANRDLAEHKRSNRDTSWDKLTNITSLNTEGTEGRPVISPDGLSLVFSSNRSGGVGAIDLWISRRADLKADWQPPVNLGTKVNTSKIEEASQILADGKTILVNREGDLFLAAPDEQGNFDLRPVPLPPNVKIKKCWLSPDGATLYFDNHKAGDEEAGTNEVRLIRRVPKTPVAKASDSVAIPAEALTFGGHRYLLVESEGTWNEAKAHAETMGGHLATINSQAERDWVQSNVWKKLPPTKPQRAAFPRLWLGGMAETEQGNWKWITGEPFDPGLWLGSRRRPG